MDERASVAWLLVIGICCNLTNVDSGGERCTRWGLFTRARHYYFPLRKELKIGLDISDIVKTNRMAINYMGRIEALLKVETEIPTDEVVDDNIRFKLMKKALPNLAREICKGEGKSLPAFHSKVLTGKIVPIMTKHSITKLLVVAKFTNDKIFLVKDVDGREIMVYHRRIDTTAGEKAASQFKSTSLTGELDEVAIKEDGKFELDMTTDNTKKVTAISFLCQYTDSVIQSQSEMNAALHRKQELVLKLVKQSVLELEMANELADADYLVGLPADSIEVVKVEPSDDVLVLIEYLEKLVTDDNKPRLDLAELEMITNLIEKLDEGVETDRGIKLHIKITDDLRTKLAIKHSDDLTGPISYRAETNTLQMGDWIIGGSFTFAVKSYNNVVIVQEFKPFWNQNILRSFPH